MTADTDTARALEVLRRMSPSAWNLVSVKGTQLFDVISNDQYCVALGVTEQDGRAIAAVPAFKALYAAAVELRAATEAHVAAATKNEQEWKHTEVHETRKREHAAHLAFVAALAAVPKAVLP